MRNKFAEIVHKKINKDKKIHVVVADISPAGKMSEIQSKKSRQLINVGVAEQFMTGFASGLSIAGSKVFIYTIAPFAIYRPYEMLRIDLCYQNLPVTIVGMGAGTIYSTLGSTHHTQEDISTLKALPNLNIICPADTHELESALKFCIKNKNGPIYLRIGKSGEKTVSNKQSEKWQFGKIRQIRRGSKSCVITYGPISALAIDLWENSKEKFSIYTCHTIKPFDENRLKKIFKEFSRIIILEDHSIIGGLYEIIASKAFLFKYNGKISPMCLKDKFVHCYGSHKDLLNKHGISTKKLKALV